VELRQRAEGYSRVSHIQLMVLERLFPGPTVAVDPDNLERFVRRHAELVPRFRRDVEARVDEIFKYEDLWQQRRALDRLESEFQDAIREVEAYMSESKFGRILRSPWCALIGLLSGHDLIARAAAASAEIILPSQPRPSSPLAYAAFASLELSPRQLHPRIIRNDSTSLLALTIESNSTRRHAQAG
jgi:hypothetical protein